MIYNLSNAELKVHVGGDVKKVKRSSPLRQEESTPLRFRPKIHFFGLGFQMLIILKAQNDEAMISN